MSTIDKKMLGITEVVTPESLDERVISRYVTQVSLGSKLKETAGGAEPEPVEVPGTKPDPVVVPTENKIEPEPAEVLVEDKIEPEPEPEIIEIPKTSEDEEIAVDEEIV